MKRFISALLCLCLLLNSFPVFAFASDLENPEQLGEPVASDIPVETPLVSDPKDTLDTTGEADIMPFSDDPDETPEEAEPEPEEDVAAAIRAAIEKLPTLEEYRARKEDSAYRDLVIEQVNAILRMLPQPAAEGQDAGEPLLTADEEALLEGLYDEIDKGLETAKVAVSALDAALKIADKQTAEAAVIAAWLNNTADFASIQAKVTELTAILDSLGSAEKDTLTLEHYWSAYHCLNSSYDLAAQPGNPDYSDKNAAIRFFIDTTGKTLNSLSVEDHSGNISSFDGNAVKAEADLTLSDISQMEFSVSRLQNVFLLSVGSGEGVRYFSPSNLSPNKSFLSSDRTPVYLENPSASALEAGCFWLKGGGNYLYLDRTNPAAFATVADADRGPMYVSGSSFLLFRNDGSENGYLPGYALVTNANQLTDNSKCLIAAIVNGTLCFLSPEGETAPRSLKTTVTLINPAQYSASTNISDGGLNCFVSVIGTALPAPAPSERTVEITLAEDDEETLFDYSGNYTDANVTNQSGVPVTVKTAPNNAFQAGDAKASRWNGSAYTGTQISLQDSLYQFVSVGDSASDGFYVTAMAWNSNNSRTDKRVYLNIHGKGSLGQGHPNSTEREPIYFTAKEDGSFVIADAGGRLEYSRWNFFTRQSDGAYNGDYSFYLFCNDNGTFRRLSSASEILDNRQYLITARKENGSFMVLHPAIPKDVNDRNAHTAQISGLNFFPYTELTFCAGQSAGNAEVTIGNTTYKITVTSDYVITQKPFTDLSYAAKVKGEVTYTDIPFILNPEKITWDAFRPDIADITIVGNPNPESFASHHNGGNNGSASGYRGAEVPLSDCLFTFVAQGNGYRIYRDNIVLSTVNDGFPGRGTGETLKVQATDKGTFTISGTKYLAFRRNNWGVFFTKDSPTQTGANLNEKDCDFYLFQPDAGQQGAPLPGYKQVTEVVSDGQYVIAAKYDGHYYILFPASSGNRNDHVVMANGTYVAGSTTLTIKGLSMGMTVGTFRQGDKEYKLSVRVTDSISEANRDVGHIISLTGRGSGQVISKLTISAGDTYQLGAAPGFEAKGWVSSDENAITVSNGLLTVKPTDRVYTQVWVGYVDEAGNKYAIEVSVINTYSSDKTYTWDFYTREVTNTEAYYTYCVKKPADEEFLTERDFRKVVEKEVLYMTFDTTQVFGLHFFAKADTGYALTTLEAAGSAGHYASLSNGRYEQAGAMSTQMQRFGIENMRLMVKIATETYGCTGGMGFTGEGKDNNSVLVFRSEKLPTVSKKVLAVRRNGTNITDQVRYEDGLHVEKGDVVSFMVTVHLVKPTDNRNPITFDSVSVEDSLKGAVLMAYSINTTDNPQEFTYDTGEQGGASSKAYKLTVTSDNTLAAQAADSDKVSVDITEVLNRFRADEIELKLFISYEITAEDVNKLGAGSGLYNTAKMEYSYHTEYDQNTQTGDSTALAYLTIAINDVLKYVNLSLSGDIGVNVYLDLKNYHTWEKYSLVFEIGEQEQTFILENRSTNTDVNHMYCGEDAVVGAEHLSKFTLKITPQDIATPIVVYIRASDGYRITEKLTFSVQDYARVILENRSVLIENWQYSGVNYKYANSQYQKLRDMICAMLNYGAYTQLYLGYHTASLANSILPAAERNISLDASVDAQNGWYQVENNPKSGVWFTGMALQVNPGSTGLRVYFTLNRDNINVVDLKTKYSFIQQDYDGTYFQHTYSKTPRVDETAPEGNQYYILIDNISAQWLNATYKITISNGRSVPEESWVQFSALTYVYLLQNSKEITDQNLKNMGLAMYLYNEAARSYFATGT